jgi:hypothetical protein
MPDMSLRPSTTVAQAARRFEQAFAWYDSKLDQLFAIVMIVPANIQRSVFAVVVKIGDDYLFFSVAHDDLVYCVDEQEWNRLAN